MTRRSYAILGLLIAFQALLLTSCHVAHAGFPVTSLDSISRQMFSEGNNYFILVEALKDGFLQEGKSYHMLYEDGTISIDGKPLPQPYQQHYVQLLVDFKAADPNNRALYSMKSDGVRMNEVLDPESGFRKRTCEVRDRNATDIMVGHMTADGLVDTTVDYRIEYNPVGIFINATKLTGETAEKYLTMFHQQGYCAPQKEGDRIIITN